ncbi:MAG: LytR family transcriptional regulator [Spirochaetaceae bacterium]|nr:MAG: LytR family transcriptional regulator [Spirochaetaceae bacterium]
MTKQFSRTNLLLLAVLVLQLAALVAGAAFILARIDGLDQARRSREDSLTEEIRSNAEMLEAVVRTLHLDNEQTNEMRELLGLPPVRPSALNDLMQRADSDSGSTHPLTEAVQRLIQHRNHEDAREFLAGFVSSPGFAEALSGLDLRYSERSVTEGELTRNGTRFFRLQASADEVSVLPMTGTSRTFATANTSFQSYLERSSAEIETHLQALSRRRQEFSELPQQPQVRTALQERRITAHLAQGEQRSELELRNNYGETLHTLRFSYAEGTVRGFGSGTIGVAELAQKLPQFIQELDNRPQVEREVSRQRDKLVELLSEPSLAEQLQESGVRIETTPRTSQRHYLFDVIDLSRNRSIGALGLHRDDATLRLFDSEDVPIGPLPELQNHVLSTNSRMSPVTDITVSEGSRTFLLIGVHERIADVVMIAHANPGKQSISILSIPRDLFYRGRRVNAVYQVFGVDRLMRELKEITGLHIDDYIMVDMYAFIDVVDVVGGVTIELEEPLRDPNFVVRDEGRWTTLAYDAGTQELSGIEALRVARSRGTSSDFERSHRQQQIVEAVLHALREMSPNQLQQAARSVFRHLDSSLSPIAAVNHLLRYRDYTVERREGLDTSNVLYHTYSNLYFQGKAPDAEVDEDFDRGAWILLPINDDWNEVRNYVQSIILGVRS